MQRLLVLVITRVAGVEFNGVEHYMADFFFFFFAVECAFPPLPISVQPPADTVGGFLRRTKLSCQVSTCIKAAAEVQRASCDSKRVTE